MAKKVILSVISFLSLSVSALKKKGAEPIPSTDLRNQRDLVYRDTSNVCLANDVVDGASVDCLVI